MRSLIKLNLGVASTSAVTTAQKHAAVYLFGSKGEAIAKRLDEMARAKELIAPHVAGLLKFLKEAPDDDIIAFKTSAAGKKTIAAAKAFATAKTIATSINSLRQIKVSGEWIEKPQGSTAPAETKTHRASKKATGKGAAPVVVENPQAPAAVEQPQTKASAMLNKVWDLSKFESNLLDPSWAKLVAAFNTEFKGRYVLKLNKRQGAFRINTLNGGYSGRGEAFLSLAKENNSWVMFANDPATKSAAFDSWYVGPKLTFATIVSYLSNELAGPHSGEKQEIDKLIAGAVIYPHQDRYFDAVEDQPKK